MEKESWRRNHGGGMMEEGLGEGIMNEESWRRNHGEGIMEEESWRRYPGGGIMRRNHRGGIMEEESWRRKHEGEIMEETSERLLRASGRPLEAPRSTQRHLGGTQGIPGGRQEARGVLEGRCAKT